MQTLWGLVVTALSLLCWGGQAVVCFAPSTAVKLGLVEAETEVEPVFWADVVGEARWDVLTLWTMLVAGVLLIADHPAWPYFGLVGGGTYLYFAGRGVFTRVEMRRRGMRIGDRKTVRVVFIFLVIWATLALVMIAASVAALSC